MQVDAGADTEQAPKESVIPCGNILKEGLRDQSWVIRARPTPCFAMIVANVQKRGFRICGINVYQAGKEGFSEAKWRLAVPRIGFG
jgi:hypothetical protein